MICRSPAVPPVDALRAKVKSFVDTGILGGRPERLWVNPDCGLKTRDWPEVTAGFRVQDFGLPHAMACSWHQALAQDARLARGAACLCQGLRCQFAVFGRKFHARDWREAQLVSRHCSNRLDKHTH